MAKEVGISIAKDTKGEDDEEVRTGFGRYLGLPITSIPTIDLDYAVLDAVATYEIFLTKQAQMETLCKKNQYGFLTDCLQVRADIALGAIGKRGIGVDRDHQTVLQERMWKSIQESIQFFCKKYPNVFDYYGSRARKAPPGTVMIKDGTGLPAFKRAGTLEYLKELVEEWKKPDELIPLTPKEMKKTKSADRDKTSWSLSLEPWLQLAKGNEFVDAWTGYADTVQLYGFVKALKGQQEMYADYRVLMRTGRTSCTGRGGGVNIQQWPRKAEFRHLFVSRPGKSLVISDYSAVELCTLASVLIDLYGQSKLGEVLKRGVDPHCYTAAMVMGVCYEEVEAGIKREKPTASRKQRQQGLLQTSLLRSLMEDRRLKQSISEYLEDLDQEDWLDMQEPITGVEMSVEQATELRNKLITVVYPEIGQYLVSKEYMALAHNLGCKWEDVICRFNPDHPAFWYVVQRVVGIVDGLTLKGKGVYPAAMKNRIWTALASLDFWEEPGVDQVDKKQEGNPTLEEDAIRGTGSYSYR